MKTVTKLMAIAIIATNFVANAANNYYYCNYNKGFIGAASGETLDEAKGFVDRANREIKQGAADLPADFDLKESYAWLSESSSDLSNVHTPEAAAKLVCIPNGNTKVAYQSSTNIVKKSIQNALKQ